MARKEEKGLMKRQTRIWLHSLVAALVMGCANGVTVMIVSPTEFNLGAGIGKLGQVVLISGMIGVAGFLKQSPLPPDEDPPKPDADKQ
jgi:hypothetical protein